MNVVVTHHIDASDGNVQGSYDYYYEYDVYRFSELGETLVARSYADTPDEAHFLRWESHGNVRLLRDCDLKSALFAQAVTHLRRAGKKTLSRLSGRGDGYEPVKLTV